MAYGLYSRMWFRTRYIYSLARRHLRIYFHPRFVDSLTLCILRGLQGIGASATIPACVSFLLLFTDTQRTKSFLQLGIMAQSFSRGSRARSVAFACFSAGAPLGAILGMALGGALVQTTGCVCTVLTAADRRFDSRIDSPTWRTPFFLEAGVNFLCVVGGLVSIDADIPSAETDKRIDWIGAFLVSSGLVLIVFALGQGESAPHQWRTGCESACSTALIEP